MQIKKSDGQVLRQSGGDSGGERAALQTLCEISNRSTVAKRLECAWL